jgi:hypothetical protein
VARQVYADARETLANLHSRKDVAVSGDYHTNRQEEPAPRIIMASSRQIIS